MRKLFFKSVIIFGLMLNAVNTFAAPPKPPIEAFEACQNSQEGNNCQVLMQDRSLSGICRLPPQQSQLVCAPDQHSKQPGTKPGKQSLQSIDNQVD